MWIAKFSVVMSLFLEIRIAHYHMQCIQAIYKFYLRLCEDLWKTPEGHTFRCQRTISAGDRRSKETRMPYYERRKEENIKSCASAWQTICQQWICRSEKRWYTWGPSPLHFTTTQTLSSELYSQVIIGQQSKTKLI